MVEWSKGPAPRGQRRRALAAALAAAALAAAALSPAEANFGEAPGPPPGREVCADGKPPRYWDIEDDPLYDTPLGVTLPRRAGGCGCGYEHVKDMTRERWDMYNRQRRPLVVAGAMDEWPAMTKWQDATYLMEGPWGKHVFQTLPKGLLLEDSPCKFARWMKWNRIGKKRFLGWAKQCKARHEEAWKRYVVGKYGRMNPGLFPQHEDMSRGGAAVFGEAIDEMFGKGKEKKKLQKKWYGKYLGFLDSSLFTHSPELWDNDVGKLPLALDTLAEDGPRDYHPGSWGKPGDYASEEEQEAAAAWSRQIIPGGQTKTLLLGGAMSRCALHIDDYGWSTWIGVVRGAKLVYMWPSDLDQLAAFNVPEPNGTAKYVTTFDAFMEQSPEMAAKFTEMGRSYGDHLWDWESRDTFSGGRTSPLPPVKPAECIVKAGELIITWDNWHAVLNLEATLAVSGTMIDRFALPMFLWRSMVYSGENMEWTFMAVEAMYYDEEVFRLVVRTIRDLARNARATGAGVGSPLWPRVVEKQAELVRLTRKRTASDPAWEMNAPLAELFLTAMIADPRLDDDDDLAGAVLEVRRDHPLCKLGRQEFRSWRVANVGRYFTS